MPIGLFTNRVGLDTFVIAKRHVDETALVRIHGT